MTGITKYFVGALATWRMDFFKLYFQKRWQPCLHKRT